ncbi:hypothetical protein G4228_011499 [Cervus hanglu yarkandensis]|nr:hypothetical protein G4228_011499 [Cervus hanglu yarkandensis]
MTKTALLKLLLAIVIMFILILPEYFKTPKDSICSMKITWYVLILLVCIVLLIFIIRKILEGHRRVQKWQSHKYKPTSVLLRGSDSEKLRTLNVRVIPGLFLNETRYHYSLELQEVIAEWAWFCWSLHLAEGVIVQRERLIAPIKKSPVLS